MITKEEIIKKLTFFSMFFFFFKFTNIKIKKGTIINLYLLKKLSKERLKFISLSDPMLLG